MRETNKIRFFAAATSLVLVMLIFLVAAPLLLRGAEENESARIGGAVRNARAALAVRENGVLRLRRFPDAKAAAWLSRRTGARIVVRRNDAPAKPASTRSATTNDASTRAAQKKATDALPEDFRAALTQMRGNDVVTAPLSSETIAAYVALWAPNQSASAPPAFVLRADTPRFEQVAAQRILFFLGAALLLLAVPLTVATTRLLQRGIAVREEAQRGLPTPAYEERIAGGGEAASNSNESATEQSDDDKTLSQVLARASRRHVARDENEVRRAEAARVRGELEVTRLRLLESEESYRQMALSSSDVLYAIYPGESRIDWLGQIDLMLGYAHGSFPRTVEAWADSIHPDEAEKVIALYTQVCKSGEAFSVEYKMRHRNGSFRDWLHHGKAVLGADKKLQKLVGSCSDITEKKRAESRLRESEERLARIIETVEGAIVLCDREGVITFANPAAELVFGANRDEIVGRAYHDARWKITQPDGAPLAPEELPTSRVLASGESAHGVEQMFSHASGRQIVVSVNAAPLHGEGGKVVGSVLSLSDITSRKAMEDNLAFRAFHDALTKLPNRALLRDRLEHALIRSRRPKTMVAVIFLDLDNFKKTNDTLGHEAGDALLIATAERLLESLRAGDTAARFAGDEFTVMLDNITELAQAKVVTERILSAMMKPVKIGEHEVLAPPSIGLALGDWRDDVDSILKRADETMYLAKKNGKARYEIHEYSPPRPEEEARVLAASSPTTSESLPPTPEMKTETALDETPPRVLATPVSAPPIEAPQEMPASRDNKSAHVAMILGEGVAGMDA